MGLFVQDGASQKACFSLKGDAGSKFCLKCSNQICILMPGEDDQDNAVCKVTCESDLMLSTNQEVLDSFDRLQARKGACSAKEFNMWEQASGWTFTQHGLLACHELREHIRPASQFMHDWMHATCSNGCLNICLCLIFDALSAHGLMVWKTFPAFLNLWPLPKSLASYKLTDLFKASRVESSRKAKKLKCQASEVLCLYAIVAAGFLKWRVNVMPSWLSARF